MLRSFVWTIAVTSVFAQTPIAHLTNTTRPGSTEFRIGDRFEVSITGEANQPISVRTTLNGRLDWGPVVARTDAGGHWSTTGVYGRGDFGAWTERWTVGGKLASPAIEFSVTAPGLPNGFSAITIMSRIEVETCDTAEGRQTFSTPSDGEPLRTPDGRVVPGRSESAMRADQGRADMLQAVIVGYTDRAPAREFRQFGDEAAGLVMQLIRSNALRDDEIGRVLAIIRAAFEKLDRLPPAIKDPRVTVPFLEALARATDQDSLKQQIRDTVLYVQAVP